MFHNAPPTEGVFKITPTTIAYFDFEQAVATSGHATAPPRAAMNSRPFTRSPRRRGRVGLMGW